MYENELRKFLTKFPVINKTKLAKCLGVSRQLLEYYIQENKPLKPELLKKLNQIGGKK